MEDQTGDKITGVGSKIPMTGELEKQKTEKGAGIPEILYPQYLADKISTERSLKVRTQRCPGQIKPV
jgi:hypothetical protein